jgi:diketogulonate reductase-like aldo/keto reductase
MPALGLGTYISDPSQRPALLESIRIGLDQGYRAIDTAWTYKTEDLVGEAIRQSGLEREAIFITTKVYMVPNLARLTIVGTTCTEMWQRA